MPSPVFTSDCGADFASDSNASGAEDHANHGEHLVNEAGVSAAGDIDEDGDDQICCVSPEPSSDSSEPGEMVYDKAECDRLFYHLENAIAALSVCEAAKTASEKEVAGLEEQAAKWEEKAAETEKTVAALKAAVIAAEKKATYFEDQTAHLELVDLAKSEVLQQAQKDSDESVRHLEDQLEEMHAEFCVVVAKLKLKEDVLASTVAKTEYLERKIQALEGQIANEEEKRAEEAKLAPKPKLSKKASRKAKEQERIQSSEKSEELIKEKAKVADLEQQIKMLKDDIELKELSNSITTVRNNYLEGMTLGLQSKIHDMPMLKAEIEKLEKQVEDKSTTVPHLLSRIFSLEDQLKDRMSTVQYLNAKVMQLLEQNREHECFAISLELNEQLKVAREAVAKQEATIAELRDKYAVASQRLEVVSAENGSLRNRTSILEQQTVWDCEAERKAAWQIMNLENALNDLQGGAEGGNEPDYLDGGE